MLRDQERKIQGGASLQGKETRSHKVWKKKKASSKRSRIARSKSHDLKAEPQELKEKGKKDSNHPLPEQINHQARRTLVHKKGSERRDKRPGKPTHFPGAFLGGGKR